MSIEWNLGELESLSQCQMSEQADIDYTLSYVKEAQVYSAIVNYKRGLIER